MKFNNFTSSWVMSVDIEKDIVRIETASKTYVVRNVSMLDRLLLIETMVNNANGEDVSVGSAVHDLMDVYEATELSEPVVNRLLVVKNRLMFDDLTLAYYDDANKFNCIGPAASIFFNSLLKELNGTKE